MEENIERSYLQKQSVFTVVCILGCATQLMILTESFARFDVCTCHRACEAVPAALCEDTKRIEEAYASVLTLYVLQLTGRRSWHNRLFYLTLQENKYISAHNSFTS